MKSRKLFWLAGTTILAITLSSCNLGATAVPPVDPGVIQTQAFGAVLTQVSIQDTQTALAIPPTQAPTNTSLPTATLLTVATFAPLNTPFAFNTQQPGLTPFASQVATVGSGPIGATKNGCNDGAFESEDGVGDGTVLQPLKKFQKSWDIKNTGTCPWDEGYSFTFMADVSTPGFEGYSIVLLKTRPEDFTKPNASQNFVLKLRAPKTPGDYTAYWKLKDDAGNFFGPLVYLKITVK
jgi:Ig-like domain from next to BRCA1 gene